ncbi:amino acid transporter [Trichodelitschia bisporula]|uniref:Amino acid transporter n=1 Tax=Trichodelitschia bisporula TaxID=703511 RepID=A0A6G1HX66_9PEZI|nr:amino acid transporter [Trichodelitschia bisporula]
MASHLPSTIPSLSESSPLLPPPRPPSPPSIFKPTLTTLNAFALLISIIIGSGIFASPAAIDTNVPSPALALSVWLLGGLLAWTGAATMASLGTTFPSAGGIQPILRHAYGDAVGFAAAWAFTTIVMPATAAILALVFAESVAQALGGAPLWAEKLAAIGVVLLVAGANAVSTSLSNRLSTFFLAAKALTITLLVLAGLGVVFAHIVHPGRGGIGGDDWYRRNWFAKRPSITPGGTIDWAKIGWWEGLGRYSAGVYGALWAYAGWDKANYVAGELRDPARQLPLALNTALPAVAACYVAVNAAYYVLLPWAEVGMTDAIAVNAIKSLLGPIPALITACLIVIVILGSLSGNLFVAGRITVAAAGRNWFPQALGRIGSIFGTQPSDPAVTPAHDAPINALLLTTLLSSGYILLGTFRTLVTLDGLTEYAFFFLTVLADLVLRVREPRLQRPYRVPVVVPLVFCIVSGAVVVRGALFAPVQAAVVVVVLAVGGVVYVVRGVRGALESERALVS